MVWRSGPPWRTRKTCVKTLKSQMMDRNAVIRNSGRSTGRISDRKVCQAPAPSTRMASYSSRGIAVSPAYSVRATNGIACQTMIRVMIAKVDRPVSNQLWLEKSPRPAALSTQLTTPNWVSNSHCQTTVAVSGGAAPAPASRSSLPMDTGLLRAASNRLRGGGHLLGDEPAGLLGGLVDAGLAGQDLGRSEEHTSE